MDNYSRYGDMLGRWLPSPDGVCGAACHRYYVVYKMGLALSIYHAIQATLLVGVEDSSDRRAIIQEGFWPLKLVALLLLTGGALYLPPRLINYLFYPTLCMGVIFVLVQTVMLVDLAYDWAESMLEKAGEGSEAFKSLLIGSTLFLALSTVAVIISVWIYFERETDRTLITVNAILLVIMTICSVLPNVQEANPSSGIFQSSLLGLYSLLVIIGAFINNPNRPRKPNYMAINYPILSKLVSVFSVVYAFLALAHSAFSTGSNLHRMVPDQEKVQDDSDEAAGAYNYSLFHASFMMASFYTILYVTFWQHVSLVNGTTYIIVDSSLAYWSRVFSSWMTMGLYIWSLFAPLILEDRSF